MTAMLEEKSGSSTPRDDAATSTEPTPQPTEPTATQEILSDSQGFKMFKELRVIEI
jgi:hypothetical protein